MIENAFQDAGIDELGIPTLEDDTNMSFNIMLQNLRVQGFPKVPKILVILLESRIHHLLPYR